MKKTKLIIALALISLMVGSNLYAAIGNDDKSKKKSKKNQTEVVLPKKKSVAELDKEKYDKLIKGAVTKDGLFITHFTPTGELYLELDKNIEDRIFLISNRMTATSDTQDFVAGQMIIDPFMVRFKVDTSRVVMYRVQTKSEVKDGDPIKVSFDKNINDPIIKTFKPVAKNNSNIVIDVTSFFGTDEKAISPIKEANPLALILGGKNPISGRFVREDSYIMGVKTFPNNIEIKSLLNYDRGAGNGYTLSVHRSIILLPKEPMTRRVQDNRVGYFSTNINQFSSDEDGMGKLEFIHRWKMEPKDEDIARYFAGELVEPKKPIVYYVDNAFPEKWRSTVIQGVKDWNLAFEAAGFKNAITARMYPTKEEDPNFDPDDMRYSCIKYATTDIANAMGPSYIDPRSGEILTGDVIWYHDVISLVHNWRFVQTAAVDSRVRKTVFDNDLMCESLRYVTSHEVGHTLGLMHNMGASYAYPVDSLRSATFTQMYGTTPSIMDYARNNFIAQPGDLEKGVRMTPPILGVYDVHAINWGYRLFKDADNERKYLNDIIESKSDDNMYRFGAQQIMGIIDPTDQTEDLGDNHTKAADYCIKNLKIILNNLEQWHSENGESYNKLIPIYKEVVSQYLRVVMHVAPEIGGVELKEVMQGEPKENSTVRYLTKDEQKKAMLWLINQSRTYLSWLSPKFTVNKFPISDYLPNNNDLYGIAFISPLFSHTSIGRMYDSSVRLGNKDAYTVETYFNDLLPAIFEPTMRNAKLSPQDMNIETAAIDHLMRLTGIEIPETASKKKSLADIGDNLYNSIQEMVSRPTICCSYEIQRQSAIKTGACNSGCSHSHSQTVDGDNSFFRVNMSQVIAPKVLTQPLVLEKLKWVKNLYESKKATADASSRNFYNYQIMRINKFLSNK